jgi:TetR/AcrR family transcriptional repressor NalC
MPLKKVLEGYGIRILRGMSDSELRSLYKVFIAVSPKFPKLASNFWDVGPQQSMTMMRDYLTQHPEFKGKHPEHAAEMFWSLCCGQLVLRALLREEDDVSEAAIRFKVKEATRIFLSAYT